MSTTQLNAIPSPPEGQDLATVPMKFEVTPIPVTDFAVLSDEVCVVRGDETAVPHRRGCLRHRSP